MIQQPVLDTAFVAPIYAVLLMDDCKLLLPQQDITILELISDVQLGTQADGQYQSMAVGHIFFQGEQCPVVCFTKQLEITREVPDARQVCAILNNGGSYLGLLCNSIDNIEREHLIIQAIPPCMRQMDMLTSALAIQDDEIFYITSVSHLSEFLNDFQQRASLND